MLFLKQLLILPFLYHESANTSHIDSYKVSNSKLKLGLCNCAKTETIEATAPPQQQDKRGTIFWDFFYCTRSNTSKMKMRLT